MAYDPISKPGSSLNNLQHCHIEGCGGIRSIVDQFGKKVGTINSFGAITDDRGMIIGSVSASGAIIDSHGIIKGGIDRFGNVNG